MPTRAQVVKRIRQAEAAKEEAAELVERAKKEIAKLMAELNKGTISRNTLESGLRKVNKTIADIPPHSTHWPYGPKCRW